MQSSTIVKQLSEGLFTDQAKKATQKFQKFMQDEKANIKIYIEGKAHPNEVQRRRAALHEAGHTLIAHALSMEIMAVNILEVPKTRGGSTFYKTNEKLEDNICVDIAGYLAQELFYNKLYPDYGIKKYLIYYDEYQHISITKDTSSDINRALKEARSIAVDECTVRPIDSPVIEPEKRAKKIIEEQTQRAKKILLENQKSLMRLVNALLMKKVLFKPEITDIIEGRTDVLPFYPFWAINDVQRPKASEVELPTEEHDDFVMGNFKNIFNFGR